MVSALNGAKGSAVVIPEHERGALAIGVRNTILDR